MGDIIQLSIDDPWWMTALFLIVQPTALVIMVIWAIDMLHNIPEDDRHLRPWRMSWPWCLTWWLFAVAVTVTINIGRVLLREHVVNQDEIGQVFRWTELAAAVNLAFWSVIAFIRWRNPKGTRPVQSSFSEDTVSVIDGTATDVAEVKIDVKAIQKRLDDEGIK